MNSEFELEFLATKYSCRVCESSDFLLNIFVNKEHNIAEKIYQCSSVQLFENDGLPQHICTKCYADLEIAFAFRKRCEATDWKLRQIANIKEEEDIEEANLIVHDEPFHGVYAKAEEEVSSFADETMSEDHDDSKKATPKTYPCNTCGEILHSKNEYSMHIKTHGKLRHQCKTCLKYFTRNSILVAHERSHLGQQKRFPCSLCSQDFSSRSALARHVAGVHENRREFICNICGKAFAQKVQMQTHQTVHNGATYQCSKCPAKYKTKLLWLRHEQTHLPEEERDPNLASKSEKDSAQSGMLYSCSKCPFKYKSRIYYIRHEQMHLPPEERDPKLIVKPPKNEGTKRIYVCSYCGKISSHLVTHVIHERYHLDVRPYPCSVCGKRFRVAGVRKKHMRIHTGLKPFKCDLCGACFRQKSHLTTHNLTHTQEKNHVCQICSKAFSLKATLKSHMKCHSVFTENKD